MRDQDNVSSSRWVIGGAAGLSLAIGGFINLVAFSQQSSTTPPLGPGGGAPQTATAGREQGAAPVQPAGAGPGGRAGAQVGTPVRGPNGEVWGYSDTAFNPGSRWRIHDPDRPQPPVVTPGETVSIPPPSDAIVLFGGKDLSAWVTRGREGGESPAAWAVRDGYFESSGGVVSTRESFSDVQLHLEFAMPVNAQGSSQGRGNGGIIFMGRYEIQLLDSYNNRTYADGMAASIYGEWPPLVNAARKPGEWQSLDIVFEAPRFAGRLSPGYFTVFWNGSLVHNRTELRGATSPIMTPHEYTPHDAELPLQIQGRAPIRYRNFWIRRLKPYDQGTKSQ